MAVIIDKRLNPKGKNHLNRQKFLDRIKGSIQDTVKESVHDGYIKDIGNNERVRVRSKDVSEPSFSNDRDSGIKKHVLPGNKHYSEGDTEPKPQNSSSSGPKGSPDGEGNDDFYFTLTRDEFLNYLFDDLELPDFIKKTIRVTDNISWNRAGFTSSGSPANLNIERTFKKSIGRRLALNRPSDEELAKLEKELEDLKKDGDEQAIKELEEELIRLKNRQKIIPYIDENDLKYTLYQEKPNPSSQAVMFCLMDVSFSMGYNEKDIAKRFFLLLYLFLEKKYDKIDICFVRHTHEADEVDEDEFFYGNKSGGTQISSGLEEIKKIISNRYSPSDWNIYIAQCTDGDNYPDDNKRCEELINELLDIVQYYSYVQISQRAEETSFNHPIFGNFIYSAWPMFKRLSSEKHNMECRQVQNKTQIWQVFRSLFEKKN